MSEFERMLKELELMSTEDLLKMKEGNQQD